MEPAPVVPRKLSTTEIEDIVNGLPDQLGAIDDINSVSMDQVKAQLRIQLEQVSVVPTGIDKLKESIYDAYEKTRSVPGTAVGIRASLKLGAPMTQLTLNSFHKSGALKADVRGIDAVTALITASRSMKGQSVTVSFKDKHMDIDDVLSIRKDFVEATVSSLTKEPIVDLPSAINGEEEPPWYSLYRDVFGPIPGDDLEGASTIETSILELNMDVDSMFISGISMSEVAKRIDEVANRKSDLVVVIYSPTVIGKIHIYPKNSSVSAIIPGDVTIKDPSLYFINSTLIGSLEEIKVKGITNIRSLHPVDYPIWNLVDDEIPIMLDGVGRAWVLYLDRSVIYKIGIGKEHVSRMISKLGMSQVDVDIGESDLRVNTSDLDYIMGVKIDKTPEGFTGEDPSPSDIVKHYSSESSRLEDEFDERKQQKLVNRDGVFQSTPYQKASKYWYAETEGSNLNDIRFTSSVDPRFTYSNDINEVYTTLGIEATRSFIIMRLLDIVNQGGATVDPKNVMILADNMTNFGVISKMTGASMQKEVGFLTSSTYQSPMTVFTDSAAKGSHESIVGPSASIFVGSLPKIGTGYHEDERLKERINEMIQDAESGYVDIDDQDFEDSIGNMTGLLFGESRLDRDPEIPVPSFEYGPGTDKTVPIARMPLGTSRPLKPIQVRPNGAHNIVLKEALNNIMSTSCASPDVELTFDTSTGFVLASTEDTDTGLITQQDTEDPMHLVPEIVTFTTGTPGGILDMLAGKELESPEREKKFVQNQKVIDVVKIPVRAIKETEVPSIDILSLIRGLSSL